MGDAALRVDVAPDDRHAVAAALAAARLPQAIDIVPGEASVLVRFTEGHDLADAEPSVRAALLAVRSGAVDHNGDAPIVVPMLYDGPDLDDVAELAGLSRGEVVAAHRDADFVVAFMGFAPGFGYLDGLPEALAVPRLATPRQKVAAGSVAIAGKRCCVYPGAMPGGWRIIGHTALTLFDPRADPPAVFSAGRRVRFSQA
jgi:KipI family sensor histidine kinase inhibitor